MIIEIWLVGRPFLRRFLHVHMDILNFPGENYMYFLANYATKKETDHLFFFATFILRKKSDIVTYLTLKPRL